jgi:Type ISP C-terminal specificity domain
VKGHARTYPPAPSRTRGALKKVALAIGYAPSYLGENADGIRQDWPRVPVPATREALFTSAELGHRVAALLDIEEPVDAVSTAFVRHELRPMGVLTAVSGRQLDPSSGDLAVTAGWGHAGQSGVTMPGRGRLVERPYADAELAAFREGLADLGLTYDQRTACLGGACYDVYLNARAYWRWVPARVWTYTIGGYQVMKKWLSYRERALLGRDLKPDEARYVTEMTRRIAAILLLEPALDANYECVKADTCVWPQGESLSQP